MCEAFATWKNAQFGFRIDVASFVNLFVFGRRPIHEKTDYRPENQTENKIPFTR